MDVFLDPQGGSESTDSTHRHRHRHPLARFNNAAPHIRGHTHIHEKGDDCRLWEESRRSSSPFTPSRMIPGSSGGSTRFGFVISMVDLKPKPLRSLWRGGMVIVRSGEPSEEVYDGDSEDIVSCREHVVAVLTGLTALEIESSRLEPELKRNLLWVPSSRPSDPPYRSDR